MQEKPKLPSMLGQMPRLTPSGNVILPRLDLREEAFRKYEKHMAAIARGSCELNPKEIGVNMGTRTYMARLRDAIRGWKVYRYVSLQIPPNACFDYLKFHVTNADTVYVENTYVDLGLAAPVAPIEAQAVMVGNEVTLVPKERPKFEKKVREMLARDWELILETAAAQKKLPVHEAVRNVVHIITATPEEDELVRELARENLGELQFAKINEKTWEMC